MASKPNEVIAAFNSLGSIVPPPSVSNKSNASLISNISSSLINLINFNIYIYTVSPGLSYYFGLNPLGTFLYFDAIIIFKNIYN